MVDFNATFEDDELPENLLDTAEFEDIDPDLPQGPELNLDGPPDPVKDDSCPAEKVESHFIALLEQGRRADIIALTGNQSTAHIAAAVRAEFAPLYAQAVRINPGLRWYARFAKMLPAKHFSADPRGLNIELEAPFFKNAVAPFMGDFQEAQADTSPIVSCVRSIASQFGALEFTANTRAQRQTRAQHIEPDQQDIGDYEFVSSLDGNPLGMGTADLKLTDDLFGTPEVEDDAEPPAQSQADDLGDRGQFDIGFADLSDKAIADHFMARRASVDIEAALLDAGFEGPRAARIATLVRLQRKRASQLRSGRDTGNFGGDVDFDPGL